LVYKKIIYWGSKDQIGNANPSKKNIRICGEFKKGANSRKFLTRELSIYPLRQEDKIFVAIKIEKIDFPHSNQALEIRLGCKYEC
jgi:hypothetical protein